jgi:hypothetical protein
MSGHAKALCGLHLLDGSLLATKTSIRQAEQHVALDDEIATRRERRRWEIEHVHDILASPLELKDVCLKETESVTPFRIAGQQLSSFRCGLPQSEVQLPAEKLRMDPAIRRSRIRGCRRAASDDAEEGQQRN